MFAVLSSGIFDSNWSVSRRWCCAVFIDLVAHFLVGSSSIQGVDIFRAPLLRDEPEIASL